MTMDKQKLIAVRDSMREQLDGCMKFRLENVEPNGEARLDVAKGRIINPGHNTEGVWFILEYARLTGKRELVEKCEEYSLTPLRQAGITSTDDLFVLSTRSHFRLNPTRI